MGAINFGPFTFDTESGELRRLDQSVRLRPQPAAVLARLTERAGELVSREELHRLVWTDGVHVNFNQGLNSCVKQVRRALRDGRGTTYIETLPRRGYRFVEPIEIVDSTWAGDLSERIIELFVKDVSAIQARGDRTGVDARARSRIRAAARHAVLAALSTAAQARPTGARSQMPIGRSARALPPASR